MFVDQKSDAYLTAFNDEITELPKVHFRPEVTEVAAEANAIGEAIELRTHTIGTDHVNPLLQDVVADIVKQYQDLKSNVEFDSVFGAFDRLAAQMGEQIGSVFNILTSVITPEVEALSSSIEEHITSLLRQDNKEIVVDPEKTAPAPITFKVCNWDNILARMGGPQVIKDNFIDITKREVTGDSRDLDIDLNREDLRIQPLGLSDEIATSLFAKIEEQVGAQAPDFKELFELAIGRGSTASGDYIPSSTVRAYMTSSNPYNVVVTATDLITRFADKVDTLKRLSLNVSDETLARYQTNLEIINRHLVMAAYTLMLCRKFFQDALVIHYDVLNSDLLEAMSNANLTEADISTYLHAVYDASNLQFPNTGISINTIQTNLEGAKNVVNEQQQHLLQNAELVRNEYRIRAVRDVLVDHIQQTEQSRIPEGMSLDSFVKAHLNMLDSFMTHLDSTDDNNLQNFLYKFVIETYYPGSIVASVHQLFGTTLTETLKVKPEVNEGDIAAVNLTVAAKLAADFLFKEIVCAHKPQE